MMFSFFCLHCETPSCFHSLFHCVSPSFVCMAVEALLTLKRLSSRYLTPIEDVQTHTHFAHIYSSFFFSFYAHKPLSLNFFLSSLLRVFQTPLCLPNTDTQVTPQKDTTEEVSENTYIIVKSREEKWEYRGRYPFSCFLPPVTILSHILVSCFHHYLVYPLEYMYQAQDTTSDQIQRDLHFRP